MASGKIIDIRGRKLGGATPLICSPLLGRTRERLLAEAAAVLAKSPDVIEWRVDHFAAIADTAAVLDSARALRQVLGETPLIFTRRSIREGGEAIAIDDEATVSLYAAIAAAGLVDFLDFEMSNDPGLVRRVVADAHQYGSRVILSYHNFSATPEREFLVQRFKEAERLGGDVAKLAVMPVSRADVLTLLAATAEAEERSRIPLISMAMGPLGAVTRMIAGLFGSSLSFAVGEGSSAPGQMPIADLKAVFEIIRRTR